MVFNNSLFRFYHLLFFILLISFIACKNDAPITKEVKNPNALPAIPLDKLDYLADNCDYVDYIFYDLPYSLSQSNPAAIRTNLSFLSTNAWDGDDTKCSKSLGREFFHVKGEIVMEAEFYFNDNCKYYKFMDGNTPLYTCKVSTAGINFYTNIFNQLKPGAPKGAQPTN